MTSAGEVPRLLRQAAICQHASARPDLLRRLERRHLLVRAGEDLAGRPLYDDDGLRRFIRVSELLQAGYPERDIASVLGQVESRRPGASVVYVEPADLLGPPRDAAAELGALLASGLASPDAIRDDAQPLFLGTRRAWLGCLLDLVQLGLDDAAREVSALDPASPHGTMARGRFDALRATLLIKHAAASRLLRELGPVTGGPKRRTSLLRRRRR